MNPNHESPDLDSAPSGDSDAVDEIVEDLAQQDVLPNQQGSINELEDPLTGELDDLVNWDEPIGEGGHRAPRKPLEDEINYAETLVSDGLDEADEELRELDENEEVETES